MPDELDKVLQEQGIATAPVRKPETINTDNRFPFPAPPSTSASLSGDDSLNTLRMPIGATRKPRSSFGAMIFSIIVTVIMLGFSHIFHVRTDGAVLLIFNEAVIHTLALPLILWCVLEIVTELAKFFSQRYSIGLCILIIAINAIIAMIALTMFNNNDFINPEFISFIQNLGQSTSGMWFFDLVLPAPGRIIIVCIFIGIIVETIEIIVKTIQAHL